MLKPIHTMDYSELLIQKKNKTAELTRLIEVGEAEKRELSTDENAAFAAIQDEIRTIDALISAKENTNTITINKEKTMSKFNELIVRSNGTIENFSTRAITLATGLNDVQVNGDLSVVGYEPFYKQMGVQILPNLTSAIKLPFQTAMTAGKVAEGVANANGNAISTVLLQPGRYTVTETIGKELLSVGNEAALQAFLFEMVKAADRAVTKDIFDVLISGASAVNGLVGGYTTANMDAIASNVDGDVTFLFPRAEFYKAKAVKIDAGSGLFVANKTSQFAGQTWDGTPLFYSSLFSNATIVAADLKHVTVGEFGDEYEIIFDNYSKAPEGQVVVTVCKLAGVVLRNTLAAKKALVGA